MKTAWIHIPASNACTATVSAYHAHANACACTKSSCIPWRNTWQHGRHLIVIQGLIKRHDHGHIVASGNACLGQPRHHVSQASDLQANQRMQPTNAFIHLSDSLSLKPQTCRCISPCSPYIWPYICPPGKREKGMDPLPGDTSAGHCLTACLHWEVPVP